MSSLFSLTTLALTLRSAVPYACAALGGVWAERSGVIHIGLEGMLLVGGFCGIAAALATDSAVLGIVAGVAAGSVLSLVHVVLVERARIHAVVSGIALNLFAYAATRLGLNGLYGSASNSPKIEGFRFGPGGASGAAVLGRVLSDPVTLLAVLAIAATPWLLANTRFGLRLRAAGEHPEAAAAAGLDVTRIRYGALAVSGALVALGGVHLAFDQHKFESGMSNNRGYMALAAVVVSGWRGGRAAAACLVFGALETLRDVLQGEVHQRAVLDLLGVLPYAATLGILAFTGGRTAPPKGLGKVVDPPA